MRGRLSAQGCQDRWETIHRKLAGWVHLTSAFKTAGRVRIKCRQASHPEVEEARLARAVGVPPPLHRVRIRTPPV